MEMSIELHGLSSVYVLLTKLKLKDFDKENRRSIKKRVKRCTKVTKEKQMKV